MRLRRWITRMVVATGLAALCVSPACAQRACNVPCDGAVTIHAVAAPCSTSVRHPDLRAGSASIPVLPERRSEKPEHGKAAPTPLVKAQGPNHRMKTAGRGSSVTPGMGSLLRMSTGAGEEISWTSSMRVDSRYSQSSGRGPPRAHIPPTFAPAASPSASPARAESDDPALHLPGSRPGNTPTSQTCALHATGEHSAARLEPCALSTERTMRSREVRAEGAALRPTLPSGGRDT